MYHQILTYRGYDHLNIPDVTRYDALVSAADHASTVVNLGRTAYGREITVSIDRRQFGGTADWSDPTYLAVWQNGSGLHLIYTVTQVIDASTLDSSPAILIKGRLNGALTAKIAEGATSMVTWSGYSVSRSCPDPTNLNNDPQIVPAGDDVPGYSMVDFQRYKKLWIYPDDYMVVISWLLLPGTDGSESVVRDHRLLNAPAPYVTVISVWQEGGTTTPYPCGTTAFQALVGLMHGLGQDANKIYRIQLVPREIVDHMVISDWSYACVVDYSIPMGTYHISGSVQLAPLTRRWRHTEVVQEVTPDAAHVSRFEAYGQPRSVAKHMGQTVLELPLINSMALPTLEMYITWYTNAIISSGVEIGLEAIRATPQGEEALLARVALGLPEIMVTDDGLTVWQQTASRQWLSSAASVGVGLAISGGNPIGAIAGLATGAISMIASADQAMHEVKSVGQGAAGVFAPAIGAWFEIITRCYSEHDVAARDRWLRAHGVRVVDYIDSLNDLTGGTEYAYIEGTGRCVIDPQQLHNVAISQEDLDAALTEDLAAGVRIWDARPAPLGQTLNHPV